MALSTNREFNELIKIAQAQGWVITKTNGGHLKWQHPSGFVYFSAFTPSDFRAFKNLRAALRRAGLKVAQ